MSPLGKPPRLPAILILLLTTGHLQIATSQTAGATIVGEIHDQQGAAIAEAAIRIRNQATGVALETLSNTSGAYSFINLQPGAYEILVQSPGFSVARRHRIELKVGAEVVVDFDLLVGSVTETVDVQGQQTAVDLVTSTIGRAVEGPTIRELPLNGRDWTQLATLQPGVISVGRTGGVRTGNGVKLAISGARPSENSFRLDGVSLNDNANTTPGNALGTNLGVESIREFSVVSNNYSAEYGRATGGVLNAVTRSGTNDLHGSLLYFHRNSALDARNFFDGATKPAFRRHQFGGAAGGPIVKNRTFWFANYESVREYLATSSISTTLTEAARQGNLSTGRVSVDPSIAKALQLAPLPNGNILAGGDTGQYRAEIDRISMGQYVLGKIDHQFSQAARVSGSYLFDDGDFNVPDAIRSKRTANQSRRQAAIAEYTHTITPSMLNVARVGYSRNDARSGAITAVYNPLLEDPSLGFIPGSNVGSISVPGIAAGGGGPGSTDVTRVVFNSYQFHENLYLSRGTHSLKTGFSLERMQYNYDIPNLTGGQFSFGSIADYLGNRPSTFAAQYPGSSTQRGLRQTLLAGYFQDDWRVRSNLSINLGLRYEFLTIPSEVNGRVALLHNLTDTAPSVGRPILDFNPTKTNFAPRAGIVWDPFKDGKTSIRASAGLFDSLPLPWIFDTPLARSLPYFLQGISTAPPANSFPGVAYTLLQPGNLRTAYVQPDPPRGYSAKWNFSVQREVYGWLADVGYSASRGIHLPLVERNMNTVIPFSTPTGWAYPANGTVLNPNFSSIDTSTLWNADSKYHALQASLRKSMANGLQLQASYTWGKSIDTASSTGSGDAVTGYSTAVAVATPLIPSLNTGLSDFDIRHLFVFNLIWEIPAGSTLPKPAQVVLSGWQLGSILRAQTGTPFSVVLNNDQAGSKSDTTGTRLGQRPNLVLSEDCRSVTNPGQPSNYIKTGCFTFPAPFTLGNVARNSLTAPGLVNYDMSLFRNVPFTEKIRAQIRFEAFNLFNHTNFAAPNGIIFDRQGRLTSTVGIITATNTDSRQFQVGMKILF